MFDRIYPTRMCFSCPYFSTEHPVGLVRVDSGGVGMYACSIGKEFNAACIEVFVANRELERDWEKSEDFADR